jgi:hypothetical protein
MRWQAAKIGIVLAVLMLALVLAAIVPTVSAITIETDTTSTVELETVKLTVMGVAGDKIRVEGDSDNVIFKAGIDDTPTGADFRGNWFSDAIDEDGIRNYAVEFDDTGYYTITVSVTEGDRKDDYDTVDITVFEKEVVFDLPYTVMIGDKINIQGTATSGTYVSVYIDDVLYNKLTNIVIEDGEFSKEVKTTDVCMVVPGSVRLKAWIDCEKAAGEDPPSRSPDGEDTILMPVVPPLTVLSTSVVALEDDFRVEGSARGPTEVTILCVPPKGGGGKSLLDNGEKGLSPRKASVSTIDSFFTKKMTAQEDADVGYYDIYVLSSGMDGEWGMSGEASLETALNEGYNISSLTEGVITKKTQAEIEDILEDLIHAAGSDDSLVKNKLKVETPYVMLDPIATVAIGEPLVVTGTTNRQEGYVLVVTCKGPVELAPHTVKIENGAFSATFDTTGAVEGEYTVKADDGDGHTDEIVVRIGAVPPLVASIDVSATSPHVANGTDASSVVVTAKDASGNPVVGADIVVVTRLGKDSKQAFNTTDNLNGTYSAFVTSTETGDATVIAEDLTTGVSGRTWVVFEPGPVVNITLTATKPRNHKPKNASNVRALAMDAFGNQVPPPQAKINIKTDLGTVSPTTIDENGAFIATVTSNDLGTANVTATETETEIDESVQMVFPALSCGSEEDVALVGCTFTAPVNIFVSDPNRALGYYDLKISFDGSIIRFSNVTDGNPNDEFDAPNVKVIDDNTIRIYQTNTISMLSPTGSVDVANITFQVVGVGSAPICMALWDDLPQNLTDTNGTLLPSTPNVGKKPKAKEKKKLHLCIHRVDGSGNTDAEIKADIKKAQEIFNAALGNCCAIEISWDKKINKITKKDWKNNIDKDGDGKLDDFTKPGKLTKEEKALLKKNKNSCINVYYVKALNHSCAEAIAPIDVPKGKWGVVMGDTEEANPKKEESCKNDVHNDDLAHELGHMLLNQKKDHVGDPKNLMDKDVIDGSELTEEQCKLIMESQFLKNAKNP